MPGSMTSIDPYSVGADSISAREFCLCRCTAIKMPCFKDGIPNLKAWRFYLMIRTISRVMASRVGAPHRRIVSASSLPSFSV